MIQRIGACLLLCLAAAPVARAIDTPAFEGPQAEIDAIVTLVGAWARAREAGDIEGVVPVYHPDMKIFTRNQSLYARHAGVRRYYSGHYHRESTRRLISSVDEIRLLGEMALVSGRFLALEAAH